MQPDGLREGLVGVVPAALVDKKAAAVEQSVGGFEALKPLPDLRGTLLGKLAGFFGVLLLQARSRLFLPNQVVAGRQHGDSEQRGENGTCRADTERPIPSDQLAEAIPA